MTPDSVIVVVGVLIGRRVDFVLSYQSDICELIKQQKLGDQDMGTREKGEDNNVSLIRD